DRFSFGLKKSLFNFMHGICFDYELQEWFDFKIPRTTIPKDFIENALNETSDLNVKPSAKVVWLGVQPTVRYYTKSKKGNSWEMASMAFHSKTETFLIDVGKAE